MGAIGAVATLRLLGFAATVFGVQTPAALAVPYITIAATIGFGLYAISRGLIIEPPAFVTNAMNALTERFSKAMAPS